MKPVGKRRVGLVRADGLRTQAGPAARARAASLRRMATHGALPAHAAALLFVSGMAGLVYQMLWIKQLSLVVGVEVHAVTTAVSAFFGGLALGGWWGGRWADAQARPLRCYAGLEVAIAALAVISTLLLPHAAAPFAWLEDRVGVLAWGVPFVLVGVPAVAMGGTLPVLMRIAARHGDPVGRGGGQLYAANTAGAIAGTLLVSFVLIPSFGIQASAWVAAGLNGCAAVVAFVLDRRAAPMAAADDAATPARGDVGALPAREQDARDGPQRWRALGLYAVAGGIALGYEVVWSQAIAPFISTRAFAFAIVLATYLTGLALGSAIAARHADRARDPSGAFALLIALAGLTALVEPAWLGPWLLRAQGVAAGTVLALTDSTMASMSTRFAIAALCVVFVPTLLLGAAFPFVLRLAVAGPRVATGVGRVIALNTVGGIAGSMLAGFVLVPWLGVVHALGALALAACVVALTALTLGQGVRTRTRWAVAIATVATLVTVAWVPADRLATALAQARGGRLVFYDEGRGGTVAVMEQGARQQGARDQRFRRLYIQGVSNSGDAMTSLRYMRLQALLPLLVHRGTPHSVLVIGLGTGITAGATLAYPGLDRRVVAELLPAVTRAAPMFTGNFGVVDDRRVEIRVRDGRRELLRSAERYDLITLEPPPPSAAGVVNLYSTDFYRIAAARLARDGIVAQWLPLPTQNDADTRALVRSFLEVYPYASLWSTELHEMLLVGSPSPLELDAGRIAARMAEPAVADALGEVGVRSPAALLATWVTDRAGLLRYAGDAPAVTDDRPRIEYASWVRRGEFARTLETLLALQTEPPLVHADASTQAAIAAERAVLHRFYLAGLAAYRGDRATWARHLDSVLRIDGGNPYYGWFVGGGHPRGGAAGRTHGERP